MSTFSGTQGVQKESDGISGSFDSSTFIKKVSQALRIQALEADNELLKSKILQFHREAAEADESADERNKLADEEIYAEQQKEKCEMVAKISTLNSQLNEMRDRINYYQHEHNEMEGNFKKLEENYQPTLNRLVEKLRTAIDKAKLATEECRLLKHKEESFSAREKELEEKIRQLEQENKAKVISDRLVAEESFGAREKEELEKKIRQLEQENKAKADRIIDPSKENSNKIYPPQIFMRVPTIDQDDDRNSTLSSLTSCYTGTFKAKAKETIKYCGVRTSVHESLTYGHLRKTRTSMSLTKDTESASGKRKRESLDKN